MNDWSADILVRMSAKREVVSELSVLRTLADKDVRAPAHARFSEAG